MSIPAQFVEDVEMGVKGRCAIETCLCSGGNIMSREAVIEAVNKDFRDNKEDTETWN